MNGECTPAKNRIILIRAQPRSRINKQLQVYTVTDVRSNSAYVQLLPRVVYHKFHLGTALQRKRRRVECCDCEDAAAGFRAARRYAATGTKQLRLYSDTSGKSAYILKIGTGKAAKPVRLPKDAPLAKAEEAVVATSFLASSSCSYRPTRMRVRVLLTLRAPKPASNRTQP